MGYPCTESNFSAVLSLHDRHRPEPRRLVLPTFRMKVLDWSMNVFTILSEGQLLLSPMYAAVRV